MAISYKDSGVDVTRGYKAVELMKKHVKSTYDGNVIGDLGSFGGFYSIAGEKMEEPVLVAGTDGVGTKLKYAFLLEKHDTIGIDAVAMCVNDIVCQGAKPLFFLDYYACGRLYPEAEADVVKGIAEGCRQAGCALIGGETAEMPGFYPEGEYDAMVNFGSSDLKFKNNTSEKLTIVTNYSNNKIRIRIFGKKPDASYRLVNEIINIQEPTEEILIDTDSKYTDKVVYNA